MIQTVENIGEKLVSMLTYDASQPLIFSSGLFLFLFAGFLFFYGFTRRAPMARIVYVILFSLYFYYKSSGIYFLLLVFASVSDYWIAHAIYKVRTQRAKYWLVGLSVLVNLGMLGYFKYTNFLIEIANNLFGQGFLNFQNIFLPVGISFFVFQSMSYTIDICRGQLKPLNNWADYLFYLSFFPQLVAGPIVRAKDFIPQIRQNPLRVTREMFGMGVFLILIGLFKKAVISDYISLNFVDRIFDEPLLYSGFECLMGIYGYALQIYCDFSGYSDMAIGLGHFFGFHFLENFNYPYESRSVTEFWRRWHISLSTWFREYVYIPLGGNRKGLGRQLLNIAIVWFLTGLWHGASWNFVLWGVYYAVLLLLEKTFLLKWLDKAPRFVGHVYTCFCFVMGWVLFAITDLGALGAYVGHMFSGTFADSTTAYLLRCGWLLLVLAVIGCTSLPKRLWEKREQALSPALSDGLRTVWVVVVLLVSMAFLVGDSYNPFLYFRF